MEKYRLPEVAFGQLVKALTNPDTGLAIAPLNLAIAQTLPQIPRDVVPDMPDRIIATSLGSEGRSTATTVLSLSAIRSLKQEPCLPEKARKLLSFTDNRQDASL